MFLRITTALMILLIPFYSNGALITDDRYLQEDALSDIAVLKSIIARKPHDLINLKRLIELTYTLENFDQTEMYCKQYLAIERNSEMAYLKIIAAASSGKFKSASDQTLKFIDEYKNELSGRDITLLRYMHDLYNKSTVTKGYPTGAKKSLHDENSIIKSYIPQKNLFTLYNTADYTHSLSDPDRITAGNVVDYPDFLSGFDAGSINFISLSSDGREILISTGSHKSSKIYIRKYIHEKKKWSSWESPDELNPGKWNHYPNFINNNTVLFSSSDGMDYDLYISHRDDNGDWSKAYKISGINTPLDEISAWVHPDGNTLYFSTNGREGMGGFDIYGARLIRKENQLEASEIKNIAAANTFRNEKYPLFVTPSCAEAYFNFHELNKYNVFQINAVEYKPVPVFFYNAEITDDSTGLPVTDAAAVYKTSVSGADKKSTVYSDGFTGTVLQRNLKYTITLTAPGYEQFTKTIAFTSGNTNKDLLTEKISLKRKAAKQETRGFKTLITSLKLIDCEESKSLPVRDTLEKNIGMQPDGNNSGKNITSFTVCGDVQCAILDGKTISADYVVFGTISKLKQSTMKTLGDKGEDQYLAKRVTGSVYILELKLLETATGRTVISFKRTTANPDLLKNIADEFVKKTEKIYLPGN